MAQRPSLLQAASDGKYLSLFQELTEDKHIDYYKDKDGNTLLSVAARNGHADLVELLLAKDARIWIPNSDGKTPLIYAAENGHKEIVELLLKSENRFNHASLHSAASAAASKGHDDIVISVLEDFHSFKSDRNSYASRAALSAAAGGHGSLLRRLIGSYDLQLKGDEVQSALNSAAAAGQKDVVHELLQIRGVKIDGSTALYQAVQAGHKDVVSLLLEGKDIDMNGKSRGESALSAALDSGHEDLAEMLYARGRTSRRKRRTALHRATSNGETKTVKWLLTKDEVEVNAKDSENETPLHMASSNGHTETVNLLLAKNGIITNARNDNNATPLHMAAWKGHTEIVELLLARNDIIINARTNAEETPLHMAAENGRLETVKLLLARKDVNVNTRNRKNKTPLHTAVNNGYAEIVRLLLESGGAKSCSVTLLLYDAAEKGSTETAKLLLTRNESDINVEIDGSRTLLHIAAENGHAEIVKLLLETDGINVNVKSRDDKTPLFSALKKGHKNVITLLLERDDLDLEAAEFRSGDLIHWAAETEQHDLVDLVLARECNANPNRTPLTQSSENGYLSALECLLKRDGTDVNSKDSDGRTPLSRAAEKGHGNVVEILLRYNADGNFKDSDGQTPLLWAARNEDEEVVKQLEPHDTGTLLFLTREGDKTAMDFILRYKPNLEQKNARGQTALHLAVLLGHRDIARALMLQGVDVNCKDDYDMTPLQLAMQRKNGDLIQELLAFKAYPEGIMGKEWRDAFGKRSEDVVELSRGPDGEHYVKFLTTFSASEELLQTPAKITSRL